MNAKKLISLVLALALVLAMSATAMAATVSYTGEGGDGATITVKNASNGETYSVYKVFDATVSADGDIVYPAESIPDGLENVFELNAAGNVEEKEGVSDDAVISALEGWVGSATVTAEGVADGSGIEFTGLPYGYYVMTTSHGADEDEDGKAAITVTSTVPNAEIYDKNSTTVTAEKTVGTTSASIGDTVTYTATFGTTNFAGEGENSKQVIYYEIKDTLPEFLTNVNVTSITVDEKTLTAEDTIDNNLQFGDDKTIKIKWATKDEGSSNPVTFTSPYANGAKITITYTAVLTDIINFNDENKNKVTIQPYVNNDDPDEPDPWQQPIEDEAVVKTYAAALKKTDGTIPLDGATFKIKGLTVAPVEGSEGVYTVVKYDPLSEELSVELSTNDQGMLYILGLGDTVALEVTEFKAPDGYNKLTTPVTVTAQKQISAKVYKKTGTIYYDADGNVVSTETTENSYEVADTNLNALDAAAVEVVNSAGAKLPETGGMGTTMLYIAGGLLVAAAAILLITKRRVGAAE